MDYQELNAERIVGDLFDDMLETISKLEQRVLKTGPLKELSITEVHTLNAIGLQSGISMGDVAARLSVTYATLSVAINKLAVKGYVKRSREAQDKRMVLLTLTPTGRRAYRIHALYHKKLVRRVLQSIQPQDQPVLIYALKQLQVFLKQEEASVMGGETP